MFDFRRARVCYLGRHFSKHKMTRYAKKFGGIARLDPPGYAYVLNCARDSKTVIQPLVNLQNKAVKFLKITNKATLDEIIYKST